MIFPEGFGHDGQGEQAQHILFVRLREFDSHGQRGDGFHRGALVHQTKLWHAFGHKFMKGERHVAGANRRTVVKTRPRINRDFCPAEIFGVTYVLGDQGIIAAGLVVGGDEQRVIDTPMISAGQKSRLIRGRVFTTVRRLAPVTWHSPFINL